MSSCRHERRYCLLGKSSLSASQEGDHDCSDDKLYRGGERDTHCKNPLENLVNRANDTM